MPEYRVTAGCGHSDTLVLPGFFTSGKDGASKTKLAWVQSPSGVCQACYNKSLRDEPEVEKLAESLKGLLYSLDIAEQQDSVEKWRRGVADETFDPDEITCKAIIHILKQYDPPWLVPGYKGHRFNWRAALEEKGNKKE